MSIVEKESDPSRGKRASLPRRVVWLLGAGIAATVCVLAALLLQLRSDAVDSGQKLLIALAQLSEEQTSRTLQNVEQALRSADALLAAARSPAATGGAAIDAAHLDAGEIDAALRRLVEERPYLFVIRVLDESGHALYASDTGYRGLDLSDRDYFKQHRDHPGLDFQFGSPVRNRVEGKWVIPASQALHKPNGAFDGVIVAGIDLLFFDRVWTVEKEIPKLSVALFRRDGTLLMRSPLDESLIGKTFPNAGVFRELGVQGHAGTFAHTSILDGDGRLFAYRRLTAYPGMVLVVGQAMDQVLAAWWRLAWIILIGLVAAAIVVGALAARLIREWRVGQSVQDRYHLMFDANPYPMVLLDRETSRFLAVNQAAVEHYGWSREDFLAMTGPDIGLTDDNPRLVARPDDGAAQPGEIIQSQRHHKKDGAIINVDVAMRPMMFNGRPAILALAHDVTLRMTTERARLAAEGELQYSQERYRMLFDANPHAVVVTDLETQRFLAVNDAAATLYGWSQQEFLSLTVDDAVAPEDLPEMLAKRREFADKADAYVRRLRNRRKDGSLFDVEIVGRSIQYDDRPAILTIVTDVSDRVAAERARLAAEEQLRQAQKMEAVGQLTGGIAHDFNNILMVIMANVEALEDEAALEPELGELLSGIGSATQRAADLTRQLLAFSRKQALRPQHTNINDLVATTGQLLRRTLGQHIEIDSILADGLWDVDVDRAQLESALVNLSINARDAMPRGGRLLIETGNVTLDEEYHAHNPDAPVGDCVMLAVSDTGQGMAPDVLGRVFEPFFTTKGIGKGTGLGLSMVYGFIRQSKGHIKIYSELGRGTSIKLYLPRSDAGRKDVAAIRHAPTPRGSERILIVEDDSLVRAGVVRYARDLGYDVSEAPDGLAGLAAFEAGSPPFELLLTDVIMPGPMNGRALADEVARRWPATRLVFMSGYTENAISQHGRLDPDVLLLSKPFRKSDLALILRQALASAARPV